MKTKKIEQVNDENKKAARPKNSSGLRVKTHVKAGPNYPHSGTHPIGGVNDVTRE